MQARGVSSGTPGDNQNLGESKKGATKSVYGGVRSNTSVSGHTNEKTGRNDFVVLSLDEIRKRKSEVVNSSTELNSCPQEFDSPSNGNDRLKGSTSAEPFPANCMGDLRSSPNISQKISGSKSGSMNHQPGISESGTNFHAGEACLPSVSDAVDAPDYDMSEEDLDRRNNDSRTSNGSSPINKSDDNGCMQDAGSANIEYNRERDHSKSQDQDFSSGFPYRKDRRQNFDFKNRQNYASSDYKKRTNVHQEGEESDCLAESDFHKRGERSNADQRQHQSSLQLETVHNSADPWKDQEIAPSWGESSFQTWNKDQSYTSGVYQAEADKSNDDPQSSRGLKPERHDRDVCGKGDAVQERNSSNVPDENNFHEYGSRGGYRDGRKDNYFARNKDNFNYRAGYNRGGYASRMTTNYNRRGADDTSDYNYRHRDRQAQDNDQDDGQRSVKKDMGRVYYKDQPYRNTSYQGKFRFQSQTRGPHSQRVDGEDYFNKDQLRGGGYNRKDFRDAPHQYEYAQNNRLDMSKGPQRSYMGQSQYDAEVDSSMGRGTVNTGYGDKVYRGYDPNSSHRGGFYMGSNDHQDQLYKEEPSYSHGLDPRGEKSPEGVQKFCTEDQNLPRYKRLAENDDIGYKRTGNKRSKTQISGYDAQDKGSDSHRDDKMNWDQNQGDHDSSGAHSIAFGTLHPLEAMLLSSPLGDVMSALSECLEGDVRSAPPFGVIKRILSVAAARRNISVMRKVFSYMSEFYGDKIGGDEYAVVMKGYALVGDTLGLRHAMDNISKANIPLRSSFLVDLLRFVAPEVKGNSEIVRLIVENILKAPAAQNLTALADNIVQQCLGLLLVDEAMVIFQKFKKASGGEPLFEPRTLTSLIETLLTFNDPSSALQVIQTSLSLGRQAVPFNPSTIMDFVLHCLKKERYVGMAKQVFNMTRKSLRFSFIDASKLLEMVEAFAKNGLVTEALMAANIILNNMLPVNSSQPLVTLIALASGDPNSCKETIDLFKRMLSRGAPTLEKDPKFCESLTQLFCKHSNSKAKEWLRDTFLNLGVEFTPVMEKLLLAESNTSSEGGQRYLGESVYNKFE